MAPRRRYPHTHTHTRTHTHAHTHAHAGWSERSALASALGGPDTSADRSRASRRAPRAHAQPLPPAPRLLFVVLRFGPTAGCAFALALAALLGECLEADAQPSLTRVCDAPAESWLQARPAPTRPGRTAAPMQSGPLRCRAVATQPMHGCAVARLRCGHRTVATQLVRRCAVALVQRGRWTRPLQRLHCNACIATPALQRLHCNAAIATPALQRAARGSAAQVAARHDLAIPRGAGAPALRPPAHTWFASLREAASMTSSL